MTSPGDGTEIGLQQREGRGMVQDSGRAPEEGGEDGCGWGFIRCKGGIIDRCGHQREWGSDDTETWTPREDTFTELDLKVVKALGWRLQKNDADVLFSLLILKYLV